MLSGAFSLAAPMESLELIDNFGVGRLCISSQTLKSLGFSADMMSRGVFLHELGIKDAPCLERLLPLNPKDGPATIRIISVPKLKIIGLLSDDIPELHFGTTVFQVAEPVSVAHQHSYMHAIILICKCFIFLQKMIDVGLTTKMHTVRVLVLVSGGPNLDDVVNFLKCYPCLERLYVIVSIKHRFLLSM